MQIGLHCILPIILLLYSQQPSAQRIQHPEDIVRKADDKRLGQSSISEMKLTVIRPDWTRVMELKVWTQGRDKLMILITDPARDRGTSYLKRGREIWNWIPRIERIVKLPPSAMMQSWMGSDFSNDDLVKQSSMVEDYKHELLGEVELDGRSSYQVRMIPREEASVVWGKVIAFIDKSEFVFLRLEYYDEDDELINILSGKHLKKMGGRIITSQIEISPAREMDHRTILEYKSIVFDTPIDEDFFSVHKMKNVK